MTLQPDTREKLRTVSTAKLASALHKRGLRNQMIQKVHPLRQPTTSMVGEAFTLRYMPAREDLNPMTVFRDESMQFCGVHYAANAATSSQFAGRKPG
jgi:regulator of RNase E activity RraA